MIGRLEFPAQLANSARSAVTAAGIWALEASRPASVGPGGVMLLGFCG
jgi:hypothetical protein